MDRRCIRVLRERFAKRAAFDTAVSRALLERVAAGDEPESLRLYLPDPVLAFGPKDVHAPGFYFHIEPKMLFVGVGIWHPDGDTLGKIRETIVEDPAAWKRAKGAKSFKEQFELSGESLKRAPKGYDPDHPLIEDLRRKDFVGMAEWDVGYLTRPDLLDRFAKTCRAAKPFMGYLTKACGLKF